MPILARPPISPSIAPNLHTENGERRWWKSKQNKLFCRHMWKHDDALWCWSECVRAYVHKNKKKRIAPKNHSLDCRSLNVWQECFRIHSIGAPLVPWLSVANHVRIHESAVDNWDWLVAPTYFPSHRSLCIWWNIVAIRVCVCVFGEMNR